MFAKQFYWYKLSRAFFKPGRWRAFQLSLCFLLGAYWLAGPRLSDGGRESYHFRRKPKLRPRPPVMVLALAASHQDLMKLRVLMSHHRKNSVREKMIGKKWIIYIYKKKKLHREWPPQKVRHWVMVLSVFIGVGNFIDQWVTGLLDLVGSNQKFWERSRDFRELSSAHFLTFMVGLVTLRGRVGFHLACWCVTLSIQYGSRSRNLEPIWF